MIIETMSHNEIARQMEMDVSEICQMTRVKMELIKFRRQITKAKDFPIHAAPFIVTTVRRNKWIVILRARSKKERNNLTIEHATLICLASFRDGRYAFVGSHMLKNDNPSRSGVIIFQPHFFARYRERYALKETGTDLIARYFMRNNTMYRDFQEDYADDVPLTGRKVYGTSEQGIALGDLITETALLFRTYVSYDMLFDNQITEYTRSEILRKQGMKNYQLQHARRQPTSVEKEESWFDFVAEIFVQALETEKTDDELDYLLLEYANRFFKKNRGTPDLAMFRRFWDGLSQTIFTYQMGKMPHDVLFAMKELGCNHWKPKAFLQAERFIHIVILMNSPRNNIRSIAWKSMGNYILTPRMKK